MYSVVFVHRFHDGMHIELSIVVAGPFNSFITGFEAFLGQNFLSFP